MLSTVNFEKNGILFRENEKRDCMFATA